MKKLDEKTAQHKDNEEKDTNPPLTNTSSTAIAASSSSTNSQTTTSVRPPKKENEAASSSSAREGHMIEVLLNDRLGKKIKVKCNSDDTVGDLKKLVAAQIGARAEKIRIQKWYTVFKDHIMLQDYEVTDGMSLELYYN